MKIFDGLAQVWGVLTTWLPGLQDTIRRVWDGLRGFLSLMIPSSVMSLLTVLGFFSAIVGLVNSAVNLVLQKLAALQAVAEVEGGGSLGSWAMQALSLANYLFPVEEMFAIMAIYFSVWGAGIAYRFVKSWIPTLT